MGNQSALKISELFSHTTYDPKYWEKVDQDSNGQIWENTLSGEQVYPYQIQNLVSIEKYQFRKRQPKYLVQVKQLVKLYQQCCGNNTKYLLLVEKIPFRFCQVNNLSLKQAIYILLSSLKGCNLLKSFYGIIDLNEKLICINSQGKIKIWVNQDLSSSQASPSTEVIMPSFKVQGNEYKMQKSIQNLLKLILNKMRQSFPINLLTLLSASKTYSEAALNLEIYLESNKQLCTNALSIIQIAKNKNQSLLRAQRQVQMIFSQEKQPEIFQAPKINFRIQQTKKYSNLKQKQPKSPITIRRPKTSYNQNIPTGYFISPKIPSNLVRQTSRSELQSNNFENLKTKAFFSPLKLSPAATTSKTIRSIPFNRSSRLQSFNSSKKQSKLRVYFNENSRNNQNGVQNTQKRLVIQQPLMNKTTNNSVRRQLKTPQQILTFQNIKLRNKSSVGVIFNNQTSAL